MEKNRAYQSQPTSQVWGCGHTVAIFLVTDAVEAAEQIAAYSQIDCVACAKAAKLQIRGILWADVKGGRS